MRRPSLTNTTTDAAFAVALGLAFLLFSFSTDNIPGGDDAYRHVKFAHRLVTERSSALADPWRVAYVWPQPVDVWFGYHLLLAPFTLVFSLVTAAKVVGALVWAAFVYALLRLFDRLNVTWRHAWVVLAVAGSGFLLYRATLMRPFLISWALVTLATLFTIEEKPWRVAAASTVLAASYSIFFLTALPVGLYLLIRRTRRALLLCVACAAGCAAGLALNPFFPENVRFSWEVANTRIGPDVARALKAGGEILPMDPWWLAAAVPVLTVWIAAIIATVRRPRQATQAQWLLLAMSLVTLAVSFRAARMFDFFPPAAVAFAASVLSPSIARHREKAAYACGFLLLLSAASAVPALATVRASPSAERYRMASEYLWRAAPNALVLNTQWEQYPFLYYWNSRSRYLTGMDPALFYRTDAGRYWLWRKLADDNVGGLDLHATARTLGAQFILVERDLTPRLEEALTADPRFRRTFADEAMSVFEME